MIIPFMKRISHHSRLSWLLASLLFLPVLVSGQAIPVTVGMNSEGQWQLYRNGEPYYINGVGGTDPWIWQQHAVQQFPDLESG